MSNSNKDLLAQFDEARQEDGWLSLARMQSVFFCYIFSFLEHRR